MEGDWGPNFPLFVGSRFFVLFCLKEIIKAETFGHQNPKKEHNTPDHFFKKCGSLSFHLKRDYDPKRLPQMPAFYGDFLAFFVDLNLLYSCGQLQDVIFYSNKDILIGEKSLLIMLTR